MEKKRAELMNTGHLMDDEMFITHLLNSLPQTEYEGAILVIKDKLRKGTLEIPEIEQVLEDKYQSMKHAKGWEEEEDDYGLFASPSNKKGPTKAFKGCCGYCGELTEFRQPLQVQSHLEMPRILVQLGHIQRT